MKKSSPAKGINARSAHTVDEYFAGVPEPARGVLEEVRATIRSVVPNLAVDRRGRTKGQGEK